jgi:hypothetical protein
LLEADDRAISAYTLNLHRRDETSERMALMAIWTVSDDGKVTALRKVDPRPPARDADQPSFHRNLRTSVGAWPACSRILREKWKTDLNPVRAAISPTDSPV